MSESVISSGEDLGKAVAEGDDSASQRDRFFKQVDSDITKYESEYKGIENSIDTQVSKSLEQTLGDKPPEVQKNILQERERLQISGQRKLDPLLVPINEQISNVEDKIKVYKPSTGVLGKFFKAKELTPQEKRDLSKFETRYKKLLDLRRQIKSTQSRYKVANQGLEEEISRIGKNQTGSTLVKQSVYGGDTTVKDITAKQYYNDLVKQSPVEKQNKLASLERLDFDRVGYEPEKVKQIHKNYNKLRENLGVSQNLPTPLEAQNKLIAGKGDKSKLASISKKKIALDKQRRKLNKEGEFTKKNNQLIIEKIKLEDEMKSYGSKDPTKALLKERIDKLEEEIKRNGNQAELEKQKNKVKGEKIEVEEQKLKLENHVERHKNTSKDLSEVKKEIKKKRDEGASDEEIEKLGREKKEKEEEIKKHKDGYKEKKKELKSSLSEKIERAKEKIKELRKKEKEGDVSKEEKEKDKKEAEELHHHVNHLEGEERDLKETHPKDSLDEHDNESFSERLRRINESDEMSVFIFFCAVSVFVFIITAFFAYNSTTFSSSNNTSIPEYALWAGGAYFLIFVTLLAIGFGKDKKTLEKIAGGVLIAGSIFMGTFFTYLKTNGDFKNLTGPESLSTSIAVAVTYIFIFFAIYYDLFEKSRSKLSSDLRIGYNIFSVILFLVLGGMVTYLTFDSEYSSDPNLKFLLPLSAGLFFLGLIGVIFAIASTSKSFDSILDEPLKLALDVIDRTNFKIIIMACFIASIYMTYILYYSYTSKDVSGSNLKGGDKISFRDNWIENSFYSGVILISFFLVMLGLTFGGNLREKAFATLMVLFIVFVGSMLLWLDGEDKIDATGDTRAVLTASEIIFVVLVVLMIYYILFAASPTGDKIISSLGKLIIQVGSIVFFVFAYSMLLAIIFWYWPGRIWDEPAELWVAFGISTAVLLGSIGLAFYV